MRFVGSRISRLLLTVLSALIFNNLVSAQWNQQDVQGPSGTIAFGTQVVVLSSGNYFVSDPGFDAGAGAVFLYDGRTHRVMSQLTGSQPGDLVGSGGLFEIGNDRIVVSSPEWQGTAGAATWMEDRAGFWDQVRPSNSIVGRTSGSYVSRYGVQMLSNRNYVVTSPYWTDGTGANMGAVTWGDQRGGTAGVVDASNSIVGSQQDDFVGSYGVNILRNGNYVVRSPSWANRGVSAAGAVTWARGTGGTVGRVTSRNSLVGSQPGDRVGLRFTQLSNSNYVIGSPELRSRGNLRVGAATLCDGANGTTVGAVSAQNSLIGTTPNEQVGSRITRLTNGNYVVSTPDWDDPFTGASDVGAVTWGKGVGGTVGYITSSNSFVGTNRNDRVGSGALVALTNGNYVFASPFWYKERGAVTWGDGGGGNSHGPVWDGNSLVGKVGFDHVGSGGVVALKNGDFVAVSPEWDESNRGYLITKDVGAVTWGNGVSGASGYVDSTNSVTGTSMLDQVGNDGVSALSNGNYVIASSLWDWNGDPDVGAVTWVAGGGPTSAVVSTGNSLIGIAKGDRVGSGGVIALQTGNYAVGSPYWQSYGTDEYGVGAVTWGEGSNGTIGDVTGSNSLIGAAPGDRVSLGSRNSGAPAVFNGGLAATLYDDNIVIASPYWGSRGVNADGIGAVTWFDARRPMTGIVDRSNSLVGSTPGDLVGDAGQGIYPPVEPLQGGAYSVYSPFWDNRGIHDAGAVTLAKTGGLSGDIDLQNSVLGTVPGQAQYGGVLSSYPWLSPTGDLFVGVPFENKVTFIGP